MIPTEAKPHEVGILMAYLCLRVREPRELARMFHYKQPRPVYRILQKYRAFLSEPETYTVTIKL